VNIFDITQFSTVGSCAASFKRPLLFVSVYCSQKACLWLWLRTAVELRDAKNKSRLWDAVTQISKQYSIHPAEGYKSSG